VAVAPVLVAAARSVAAFEVVMAADCPWANVANSIELKTADAAARQVTRMMIFARGNRIVEAR